MTRAIRAVIVDAETRRTLIVRLDDPAIDWRGYITFGGKAGPGETDEVTLRRELREELGLTELTVGRELLVVERSEKPGRPAAEAYVECRVSEFQPVLRSDDPLADPRWVTLDELEKLEFDPPELSDLVAQALER